MNFIQRFKAAWKISGGFSYITESDDKDFWTEENARHTKSFFESEAGRKLSIRLTNYTIKMALRATKLNPPSEYENGQASGIPLCIAAIELHYPQEEPTTPAQEVEMQMEEITA